MTTTADTIMALHQAALDACSRDSTDTLRTAVESLVAERDAAIAALGNPCLDACLKATIDAALRGQP